MCGIAGILYRDRQAQICQPELKRMCDTMFHRGPDDEGFLVDGHVGLGMRRLSIIDLGGGHQPISGEDGTVSIVFNGEIYNFQELRADLERRGHTFSTDSDTEAIVHAYEEYGEGCVQKLNGMFAFAIWDQRRQKLLLARDRLGVKPLYYLWDGRRLVFASEIKAILQCEGVPRTLDLQALDLFLSFEYIPAPRSIFQEIRKLPAGHVLVAQGEDIAIRRYWDLAWQRQEGSEEELSRALYDLLKDAVRSRLVSDVPLGALLSGGVDSSTVVGLMSEVMDQPVKTFSIGFDDPSYNELKYARIVARHFGTDHHELVIQPRVVDLVSGLVGYLDEPLADVSIFPTYLVSQLARQHVTVALSGDGGDELFAGYDWYVAAKMDRYYRALPGVVRTRGLAPLVRRIPPSAQKKGFANMARRFVEGSALPAPLHHFRWNIFMTADTRNALYGDELKAGLDHQDPCAGFIAYLDQFEEADPLWRQQFADIKTYLVDDILTKVDRMSMANSLEVRSPFLDYRVAEFAAGLPSNLKLRGFATKYLLKKSMRDKLPQEILHRPKSGFSIPMKNWLRQELRPMMEEVLSPDRLRREGMFNPAYVEALKAQHVKGVANHSHQLWAMMVFELWQDIYLRR